MNADSISTVTSGKAPTRPDPMTGISVWIRTHLLSSWLSTAITLALAYLIARGVYGLIEWALVHAVWQVPYGANGAPDTTACHEMKGIGACWAVVADKYRLILFGRFPYEEQWRPALVVCLFVGLYIVSAIRSVWRRGYASRPVIIVACIAALCIVLDDVVAVLGFALRPVAGPDAVAWLDAPLQALQSLDYVCRYIFVVALIIAWPMVGVWVATLATIGILMSGGIFGLEPVAVDFWGGLPITLILATFGIAFAFPLSILVALGRRSTKMPAVRLLCVLYVELIRGVPLISVLFMASVMFPLFMPPGINVDKLLRAQIAIILFAAAYLAEVIRGGLQALPKGQVEAADALGLSYWQKTGFVILPQALRLVIPPLVNTFIGFFKDTSLVLIIGLFDLLTMGKIALSDPPWQSFSTEVYITLAIIYIIFCYAMSRYSQGLERELNTAQRR
ncbi:MAG: amino acid ABC transporter permease [Acetobacteraceae bacterium]